MAQATGVKALLHHYGANLRLLGRLRQLLAEGTAARELLLAHAVARTARRLVQDELRQNGRGENNVGSVADGNTVARMLNRLHGVARASLIPALRMHFTRAGIGWCRCHRGVCMARPHEEHHHSGRART